MRIFRLRPRKNFYNKPPRNLFGEPICVNEALRTLTLTDPRRLLRPTPNTRTVKVGAAGYSMPGSGIVLTNINNITFVDVMPIPSTWYKPKRIEVKQLGLRTGKVVIVRRVVRVHIPVRVEG